MTLPQLNITDVTHVIQLAIAPVFLLNAVAALIGVLTARLGRVVDRIRYFEDCTEPYAPDELQYAQAEISRLGRRLKLIYFAMTFEVFCALFVGLLIVVAFFDAFVAANYSKMIALLFAAAMMAFIGGLVMFLREIFLAIGSPKRELKAQVLEAKTADTAPV